MVSAVCVFLDSQAGIPTTVGWCQKVGPPGGYLTFYKRPWPALETIKHMRHQLAIDRKRASQDQVDALTSGLCKWEKCVSVPHKTPSACVLLQ